MYVCVCTKIEPMYLNPFTIYECSCLQIYITKFPHNTRKLAVHTTKARVARHLYINACLAPPSAVVGTPTCVPSAVVGIKTLTGTLSFCKRKINSKRVKRNNISRHSMVTAPSTLLIKLQLNQQETPPKQRRASIIGSKYLGVHRRRLEISG